MQTREKDVKRTIQKPLGIYQDVSFADRQVYYQTVKLNPKRTVYMKVIVRFENEATGSIITAFLTDSPKSGEKWIWPSSND